MAASWTYLVGPIYTLLPPRWRATRHHGSAQSLAQAALISGFAESLLSLAVVRFWCLSFFGLLSDKYAYYFLNSKAGSVFSWETVTQAGFITFASHPLTWFILYFAVEGVVRATAALVTGEVCGTLPLYAIDGAIYMAGRLRKPSELDLVPDEVAAGKSEGELKISSCRKRPDWKYPFTIRYGGAFFQVIGENYIGRGPRPYVYSLRRLPMGEIARGLKEYDPRDVLTPVFRVERLG
ncbi:MAG: hypothetical protein ABSG27_04510 [Candidatus Acidiferrales bacterium]|jgi:hypothetical protein